MDRLSGYDHRVPEMGPNRRLHPVLPERVYERLHTQGGIDKNVEQAPRAGDLCFMRELKPNLELQISMFINQKVVG